MYLNVDFFFLPYIFEPYTFDMVLELIQAGHLDRLIHFMVVCSSFFSSPCRNKEDLHNEATTKLINLDGYRA